MRFLKKIIKYWFSDFKWARKFIGGYWELWCIEIIYGDIWMYITQKQVYNNWRPGCGRGTPYCEYYEIGYFGYKKDFTNEIKTQLQRDKKIKEIGI
jgi:hypothetical protein